MPVHVPERGRPHARGGIRCAVLRASAVLHVLSVQALKIVPGAFFDIAQKQSDGTTLRSWFFAFGIVPVIIANDRAGASTPAKQRVSLVYFVGGCTLAEVSALRFLGQQEGSCAS